VLWLGLSSCLRGSMDISLQPLCACMLTWMRLRAFAAPCISGRAEPERAGGACDRHGGGRGTRAGRRPASSIAAARRCTLASWLLRRA